MTYNKEQLDKLFDELNKQYIPQGEDKTAPAYYPTPKSAGPKALSIKEYRKRQQRRQTKKIQEQKPNNNRRKRGGKKVRLRQEVAELHRVIPITLDRKQKQLLIKRLHEIHEDGRNKLQG